MQQRSNLHVWGDRRDSPGGNGPYTRSAWHLARRNSISCHDNPMLELSQMTPKTFTSQLFEEVWILSSGRNCRKRCNGSKSTQIIYKSPAAVGRIRPKPSGRDIDRPQLEWQTVRAITTQVVHFGTFYCYVPIWTKQLSELVNTTWSISKIST